MKRWMLWLISPTVLGSLGLLIFSALVWWVGPLLAIGNWRPLDGLWARVLLIVLAWSLWLGQRVWRRVRQNRAKNLGFWQKNIKKPIGITFIQGFEIDINDGFYCLKIGHLLHLCKGGFLRLLFAMDK